MQLLLVEGGRRRKRFRVERRELCEELSFVARLCVLRVRGRELAVGAETVPRVAIEALRQVDRCRDVQREGRSAVRARRGKQPEREPESGNRT
jgi:hypothetical protein